MGLSLADLSLHSSCSLLLWKLLNTALCTKGCCSPHHHQQKNVEFSQNQGWNMACLWWPCGLGPNSCRSKKVSAPAALRFISPALQVVTHPQLLAVWNPTLFPPFTHSCWGWGFTGPLPDLLHPALLWGCKEKAEMLPVIELMQMEKQQWMALAGGIMWLCWDSLWTQLRQNQDFLWYWKNKWESLKSGEEEEHHSHNKYASSAFEQGYCLWLPVLFVAQPHKLG